MHTENPLSPRGQEVYIEKSVFFLCLFVFVLLCFVVVAFFFFYENATLKRGGGWGDGVKKMWSVTFGYTNLCIFGQISNRCKCSSTRTERKMKMLALLTNKNH